MLAATNGGKPGASPPVSGGVSYSKGSTSPPMNARVSGNSGGMSLMASGSSNSSSNNGLGEALPPEHYLSPLACTHGDERVAECASSERNTWQSMDGAAPDADTHPDSQRHGSAQIGTQRQEAVQQQQQQRQGGGAQQPLAPPLPPSTAGHSPFFGTPSSLQNPAARFKFTGGHVAGTCRMSMLVYRLL
eukprot:1161551-Pelagomonas_calceolata.AAC.6